MLNMAKHGIVGPSITVDTTKLEQISYLVNLSCEMGLINNFL